MPTGKRKTGMRSITVLAAAAVLSALLTVAARAQDAATSSGTPNIDQKTPYQPNPKMMMRAPGAASLTPGAEKRGLQTVDPAGPAAGEASAPRHHDPPAAAAAAVTTDAAQLTPSIAAQTIQTQGQ